MHTIRLTPQAEQDLRDIWQYGAGNWGTPQAERYFDAMYGTFQLISEFSEIARLRGELKPPVRLHPFRSHLIAYDVADDGIDVIRILHMRSDVLALLET